MREWSILLIQKNGLWFKNFLEFGVDLSDISVTERARYQIYLFINLNIKTKKGLRRLKIKNPIVANMLPMPVGKTAPKVNVIPITNPKRHSAL